MSITLTKLNWKLNSFWRKNAMKLNYLLRENSVVFSFLLLYILFSRFWEDLIAQHIVKPFLGHFEASYFKDALFFIAVIVCLVFFFINRRKYFSIKTKLISSIALLSWVYYRFVSDHFGFISLKLFSALPSDSLAIKYVDIIALYTGSIIFSRLFVLFNSRKISFSDNMGFIMDVPYPSEFVSIDEDRLNRRWLASRVVYKLLETDTSNGAFTFGLDAPWGAGKSSFMNMMKKQIIELYSSNQPIIIDFNPWLYSAQNDLVVTFMDELSKHLKKYDQSLAKKLIDYSKLLSAFDTVETKLVASLVNLVQSEKSLQEMKEQVASSIKRINLLIFIFIDDLDRLDADELMEMMKLIRNISNFPYMYFIAAYDKTYLVRCLEGKMKAKGVYFVEKIFQHEFHLPKCPIETLRKLLYYHICEYAYFPDTYLESFIIDDSDTNNPLNVLSNIREVKRLANHFTSSVLSFSKKELDNMNQIDILLFELFKTKYPLVLTFFERKIDEILVVDNDLVHYRLFNGDNDNTHFDFINYIHTHYEEFNINEIDERSIKIILERLFEPIYPSDSEYQSRRRFNDIDWFNRFIHLSESEIDISNSVFNAVIKEDFCVIQQKIDQWSIGMSRALVNRMTKYKSRDKKEQKVLIKTMFYYISRGHKIHLSDFDRVISKLKSFNKNYMSYTSEDKEFIESVLKENGYKKAICRLVFDLLQESDLVDFPLSDKELAHIQRDLFSLYLNETNNIQNIIREFCVLLGIENESTFTVDRSNEYVAIISEAMRNYAEKHIIEMLSVIIRGNELDGYKLNNLTEIIWGTWDAFYDFIERINDKDSMILKFKDFIKIYKDNNFKAVKYPLTQIKNI